MVYPNSSLNHLLHMKYGVLYIATGNRCCAEAIENAKRTRIFNPKLLIAIKTDQMDLAINANVFDEILGFVNPSWSYRDKIVGLYDLPYSITLFLDSDACLIQPIENVLSILTVSDFAAVSAPVRHPPGWSDSSIPSLFPELNTGVLLLCRSNKWNTLVQDWLNLYDSLVESHSQLWDQASFRSVVWSTIQMRKLRFIHLPSELNLRTTKPWTAGRGMPIYVIHGRFPDEEFTPFVNYLNLDIDRFRTWNEWLSFFPNSRIRPRFDRTFG